MLPLPLGFMAAYCLDILFSLPPRIRTWIKGFVIPYAESITLAEERLAIGLRGVEPLRTALDFNGPGYESGPR